MTEPTQPTGKHTDRVADLARRLGVEDARVWWRTPVEDGTTPTDLFDRQRRGDVHRLVLGVADPQPFVDGILQVLPRQMDPGEEDLDDTASSGS